MGRKDPSGGHGKGLLLPLPVLCEYHHKPQALTRVVASATDKDDGYVIFAGV